MNQIKKHLTIKNSCLSLCSVFFLSTVSLSLQAKQIEKEQEVRVIKVDAKTAEVSIESENKNLQLMLPVEALHDPQKLALAISGLPAEDQKLILDVLGGLNELHQEHTDIVAEHSEDKEVSELKWISKDGQQEKVMVIEVEKSAGKTVDKTVEKHKFIIKSESEQDGYVSAIKHILAKGTFSKEELAEIQNALDAKK